MFKSLFKKKNKTTLLKLNPEGIEIAGHKFRVLDPVKMSNVRKAKFFLESYERDLGMLKDDLIRYDDFLIRETKFPTNYGTLNELNSELTEKLKRIYTLLAQRQSMLNGAYQYKPFLKAANIIILIDDENENNIESKYMDLKMKLCKENEDVEAFFLSNILILSQAMANSLITSQTSSLQSLKDQMELEKRFYDSINTSIYET